MTAARGCSWSSYRPGSVVPTQQADVGEHFSPQTEDMSTVPDFDLQAYSKALESLVETAGKSVVAVPAAAYRVVSGVIFGEDLIAVNSHTLRREEKISVSLPDGSDEHATILGRDPAVDVAILRLSSAKLTPPAVAAQDSLRAGAMIAVVGRTLDAGLSASVGVLGAVGGPRRTWRGGSLTHFVRLDVSLYPSQAGAAVVNTKGELIGMATGAMSRHAGLAIPVETINRVTRELLKEGRVRRGYLGVSLQPVSIPRHLRERSPLIGESGLMILSIEPDGGAHAASLQLGDIIVAGNGERVEDTESLQGLLGGEAVGGSLKLTLLRAGAVIEAEVKVGERVTRTT
jgi:serine protease Do